MNESDTMTADATTPEWAGDAPASGQPPSAAIDEPGPDEVLIEEVSIDGMCGVY